jgi:hypothetical protein
MRCAGALGNMLQDASGDSVGKEGWFSQFASFAMNGEATSPGRTRERQSGSPQGRRGDDFRPGQSSPSKALGR